jgi:hypothetical protein
MDPRPVSSSVLQILHPEPPKLEIVSIKVEQKKKKPDEPAKSSKPVSKPDDKPDFQPVSKPDTKLVSKLDSKPVPKPDSKPDLKPDIKPVAKPDTKPVPKPDSRSANSTMQLLKSKGKLETADLVSMS